MGLGKKIMNHVGDKYIATQMKGLKAGVDLAGDSHPVVQGALGLGGLALGSAVGIARVWNPLDAWDTFSTPDEVIEERIKKTMDAVDFDEGE